jgi:hypothetical protein
MLALLHPPGEQKHRAWPTRLFPIVRSRCLVAVSGDDCIQAEGNSARASALCEVASVEPCEAGSERSAIRFRVAMQLRPCAGQRIERFYRDGRLELARGMPATVQPLTIVRELLWGRGWGQFGHDPG